MKRSLVVYIVLSVLIVGSFYFNIKQHRMIKKLEGFYSSKELEQGDVETVVVNSNDVTVTTRPKDSSAPKAAWKVKTIYRVPEGYVKIDMSEYNRNLRELRELRDKLSEEKPAPVEKPETGYSGETSVSLEKIRDALEKLNLENPVSIQTQKSGFILRPSIGAGYSGEPDIAFGLKTFFYRRYNIGIYSTLDLVGIGFGRHMDDLIPILQSSEFRIIPGYGYDKSFKIWFGLTTDL